ncbi:MAG: tyrosine--tRNA ligase [Candidatus Yanofskybacteria bacterium]|nr:tyrosine--tRNA ligase [Candidatus Yanofskybacteria bacterium]
MSNLALIKSILDRRIENVFPSREAVERRLAEEKLNIYLGIDPTGPDIHLGHTIALFFLKDLARLGHKPILLIGDFTARIGDPTGKDFARKPLTPKEIEVNAKTYTEQVAKILPKDSFQVRYNSEWLSKMSLEEVIGLASHVTVQQMIARDMFQERIKRKAPIYLHEFLYPIMQGYDSIAMEVDGEVGGNDQTFNMLVGRELEREYLQKDKLVFATRLLVDASSGKKMSKSEGNLIAINDDPQEIRRKVLAIDDAMTATIFELCTEKDQSWIDERKQNNPRAFKEALAEELVRMYHGENAVGEAQKPIEEEGGQLARALKVWGATSSISAAKDIIDSGGVRVNNEVEKDWNRKLNSGDEIQVGKGKFYKVK